MESKTIDDVLNNHAQEFKAGHLDKVKEELSILLEQMMDELIGPPAALYPAHSHTQPAHDDVFKESVRQSLRGYQRQSIPSIIKKHGGR